MHRRSFIHAIILVDAIIIIIALSVSLMNPEHPKGPFEEWGMVTIASGLQLFFVSILTMWIFISRCMNEKLKRGNHTYFIWLLIGLGFLFLAADEMFEIHEQMDYSIHSRIGMEENSLSDRIDDGIVASYLVIGIGFLLRFREEFIPYQRASRYVGAGFVLSTIMIVIDVLCNRQDLLSIFISDSQCCRDVWLALEIFEEMVKLLASGMFLSGAVVCVGITHRMNVKQPVESSQVKNNTKSIIDSEESVEKNPLFQAHTRRKKVKCMIVAFIIVLSTLGAVIFIRWPYDPDGYQIHLALTGDPTEMCVTWVTPGDITKSRIEYGIEVNNYFHCVNTRGEASPDGHRWERPFGGLIHSAILKGLQPETIYHYRVKGKDYSKGYQFTTPSLDKWNVTFAMVSDMGISGNAKDVIYAMMEDNLSMVVVAGDMSYADGSSRTWDKWFDIVEPHASSVPYMVSGGNHDSNYDFSHIIDRFRMPAEESDGTDLYYSFNFSRIHFIALTPDFGRGLLEDSRQYTWFVRDLEQATRDRGEHPWIIVFEHYPMYSSNRKHAGDEKLRTSLEEHLKDNKVDLIISGHIHCYERTHPVYNHTVFKDFPVYITCGTGGSSLDDNWEELPAWTDYREASFGYTKMSVHANDTIQIQFVRIDGSFGDELWLEQ